MQVHNNDWRNQWRYNQPTSTVKTTQVWVHYLVWIKYASRINTDISCLFTMRSKSQTLIDFNDYLVSEQVGKYKRRRAIGGFNEDMMGNGNGTTPAYDVCFPSTDTNTNTNTSAAVWRLFNDAHKYKYKYKYIGSSVTSLFLQLCCFAAAQQHVGSDELARYHHNPYTINASLTVQSTYASELPSSWMESGLLEEEGEGGETVQRPISLNMSLPPFSWGFEIKTRKVGWLEMPLALLRGTLGEARLTKRQCLTDPRIVFPLILDVPWHLQCASIMKFLEIDRGGHVCWKKRGATQYTKLNPECWPLVLNGASRRG